MLDTLIIGAGPAGMAAGIYAARAELSHLVLESGLMSGGQIVNTSEVDNYPGLKGIGGFELAMKFREHCDECGVRFQDGKVVKVEKIEDHHMHTEHFYIKPEDVEKINRTKQNGGRIISVGTTSTRVLESVANEDGLVREIEGDTNIFIYPGYKFKCVDALITNFHLPESTLLMLVSALAGKDYIMNAYEEAVKEKYRFFSFGDAMLIQ